MNELLSRVGGWILMAIVFTLLVLFYSLPYIVVRLLISFKVISVWALLPVAALSIYYYFKK